MLHWGLCPHMFFPLEKLLLPQRPSAMPVTTQPKTDLPLKLLRNELSEQLSIVARMGNSLIA